MPSHFRCQLLVNLAYQRVLRQWVWLFYVRFVSELYVHIIFIYYIIYTSDVDQDSDYLFPLLC